MVSEFFNQLQEFHEADHTCPPTLQDTLFNALKFEIFGNPPAFANHNHDDDEELTQLRMEQTRLGWGQLLRGRFSCKWTEIQQQFLVNLVVDHRCFTGDLWVQKLINLFWHFNRRLWDAQNSDKHGHAPVKNQAIRRDRLQASVHELCNTSSKMVAADRDIFHLPADERLRDHEPARIEKWIREAKPIVAISIKDATKKIKRTFQSVAAFFTRVRRRTLEDDTPAPEPRPPEHQHLTNTPENQNFTDLPD